MLRPPALRMLRQRSEKDLLARLRISLMRLRNILKHGVPLVVGVRHGKHSKQLLSTLQLTLRLLVLACSHLTRLLRLDLVDILFAFFLFRVEPVILRNFIR